MTHAHTFGGRSLDRYVYEFEIPDASGAGDPGPAAAEPAPAEPAEPAAVAEPAAAEAAAEPPGEAFDERQLQNWLAEEVGALIQAQLPQHLNGNGNQPAAAPEAGEPFDWSSVDPLDDGFGQHLGQGMEQTVQSAVQSALAPFMEAITGLEQQQQAEKQEQAIGDLIHDTISRGDDLTDQGKTFARALFDQHLTQARGRYGNTVRAAEVAADWAVDQVRALETAAAQRGATAQQNHLATLAGATTEPGASGAAGTVAGTASKYMSTEELLARHVTA